MSKLTQMEVSKLTQMVGVLKAKRKLKKKLMIQRSFDYAFRKIEQKFGLRWFFLVIVTIYLWTNVDLIGESLGQTDNSCYQPKVTHGHVYFTQDGMNIECNRGFFLYPWKRTNKCVDGDWEKSIPEQCIPLTNLVIGVVHILSVWIFMPYAHYLRLKGMYKHGRWKMDSLRLFLHDDGHEIYKEKDFRDYMYVWLTHVGHVFVAATVIMSVIAWCIYGSETLDESEEYYMFWEDLRLFIGVFANFAGIIDLIRANCAKNISLFGMFAFYVTCAIPNFVDMNQNHLLLMYVRNAFAFEVQIISSRILAFPILFGHALYVFGANKQVDLMQMLGCLIALMGPKAGMAQHSGLMRTHRSAWMAHIVTSLTFHLVFRNVHY